MIDLNTTRLHMRRVREYFAELPPLRPETVDIVLRVHLNVPEELLPMARQEIESAQAEREDDQAQAQEERKSA